MSERPTKLSKGLKQRHLTMIAIGGVIGAWRQDPDVLARRPAVAALPRFDDPDDRRQPLLGVIVRRIRIRVLVRRYQVFAIIAFLALGTLFAIGLWPSKGWDLSNLTAHGGFFPLGVGSIFSASS